MMKQATMVKPGKIVFDDVVIPKPKENEVLLKIMNIGICGSDIHVWRGVHPYTGYPVVQGHEVSAIVESVGKAVKNFKNGDKVTVQPQVFCNKCRMCRDGRYNICESLKVMGFQTTGLAAEYCVVDEEKLIALPKNMSFEEGAFIEPLAVAVHAVRRAKTEKRGCKAVVIGAGTIGNLVMQTLKAFGAEKVIITDFSDFRLNVAAKCGADVVVNTSKENLKDVILKEFGEDKADLMFECVGVSGAIGSCIENARKGSEIIVVGVFGKKAEVDFGLVQDRELELIGTLMYRKEDFIEAIKIVSEDKIKFTPLLTHKFAFSDYEKAYKLIDEAGEKAMKVMVYVGNKLNQSEGN